MCDKFSENKKIIIFWFLFIILFFILFNFSAPIVSDDMWMQDNLNGLTFGELLDWSLHFGNGRFLGNISGAVINYPVIKVIEKTIVMIGIVCEICYLVGSAKMPMPIIVFLGFMLPCNSMFSEVYTWTAGFQNYVVPVFLFLICVCILKKLYFTDSNLSKFKVAILVFLMVILSFFSQFFSENSSVIFFTFALIVSIYSLVKNKKIDFKLLLFMISNAVGLFLMLFIPRILGVSSNMNGYRSMALTPIEMIKSIIGHFRIISDFMAECGFLWCILSISIFMFIRTQKVKSKIISIIKYIILIYPIYSVAYAVFLKEFVTPHFHIKTLINMGGFAVYFISICVLLFISKKEVLNNKLLVLGFFSIILGYFAFIPLLIVSPIGGRTFYLSYIFILIGSFLILSANFDLIEKHQNSITKILLLTSICIITVMSYICRDWVYSSNYRNDYIKESLDSEITEIKIPLLPHQELIHSDDSVTHWQFYFNENSDKEITFSFVPWEYWYVYEA